ncbi:single-stranded DNA-binding protein [Lysinibacter cavernae]|uniref:single-stranded DNA-binding protein n=1 Tax=Lysinibacter cavernae TaxID=1640652 RepID=UPI0036194586
MSGETITTVVGNLTTDPELRSLPDGSNVCNFTLASTPRFFDRATNSQKDGTTSFFNVNVWGADAMHAASSLVKGQRAIAVGSISIRLYETKEGEKRSSIELKASDVGPSVKFGTTVFTKAQQQQQMQQPVQQQFIQPVQQQQQQQQMQQPVQQQQQFAQPGQQVDQFAANYAPQQVQQTIPPVQQIQQQTIPPVQQQAPIPAVQPTAAQQVSAVQAPGGSPIF